MDVSGLSSEITAITAGYHHTCVLTSGSGIKCWGRNNYGQLGDNSTTQRLSPVDVSGLSSGVMAIDGGYYHTCALTSSGGVRCWGYNGEGQLGDNSITRRLTPVDVNGMSSGVTAISAGELHTCAVTNSERAKCWGSNDYGQLGDGGAQYYMTPVDVYGSWPAPQFAWSAEGDQAFASLGISISRVGNLRGNGDGAILVGAPHYGSGGAVFVYYESGGVLSTTPDLVITSTEASALLGWSVASAGDVNLDGFEDVIVGATGCSHPEVDEGCAYVYLGSSAGLSTTPAWSAESNQKYAGFGYTVGSAGDVNNDGVSDVFVSAPNFTNGHSSEGKISVYYGSQTNGLSTTPNWEKEGDQSNAYFGFSANAAGDMNGDGMDDLLIGAPNARQNLPGEGKAFIFYGSSNGLANIAGWSVLGGQANAHLGEAVAAGDFTGDGRNDLVIGAPGYDHGEIDEGVAFVYLNSLDGLRTVAGWAGEGNQSGANYGIALAHAGDVNQDGYDDFLVGASRFPVSSVSNGKVFLHFGTGNGINTIHTWNMEGNQAYSNYGYSVGSAGDVNGDGFDDILVAAPLWDQGQVDEGLIQIFYGN